MFRETEVPETGDMMEIKRLTEELVKLQFSSCDAKGNIIPDEKEAGEMRVLYYLMKKDCAVLPGELSRQLHLTNGRISNTLNALEKKKYILRTKCAEDKRKILVELSEDGKEYISGRYKSMMEKDEEILRQLGAEDAETMLRIMRKLSVIISRAGLLGRILI